MQMNNNNQAPPNEDELLQQLQEIHERHNAVRSDYYDLRVIFNQHYQANLALQQEIQLLDELIDCPQEQNNNNQGPAHGGKRRKTKKSKRTRRR